MQQFPKDEIVYKLIPYTSKYSKLSERPHRRYLNMAVVYEIAQKDSNIPFYLFEPVTNKEIKEWQMNEQALFEAASKNTEHLLGYTCTDVFSQMQKLFGEVNEVFDEREMGEIEKLIGFTRKQVAHYRNHNENPPMYILSNREARNGASCILYPNTLRNLSRDLADSFFLVPGHDEMIAVPAESIQTQKELRWLIGLLGKINFGWGSQEEPLSETLLYYNRERGVLDLVGGITQKKSTPRRALGTRIIIHEKRPKHMAPK